MTARSVKCMFSIKSINGFHKMITYMTTVVYLKILSLLKSNMGNSSLPEELGGWIGSSLSQKLCMSLSCAHYPLAEPSSLACSCQGWSWGCLREAGEQLKEQWMSGVVCEGKSKWLGKKWESINGNKHKPARKNNKLSKDVFLIVNAGISTSLTAISYEW